MTDPLADFVLACAEEDEEIAKVGPYDPGSEDYEAEIKRDDLRSMQLHSRHCGWRLGEGMSDKCECGAPERVLARCAADRALVELHSPAGSYLLGDDDGPRQLYCSTCGSGEPYEYPKPWPCETLRLLANANADHPDFRPEWKL